MKRTPERIEFLSDMLDTALAGAGYWAEVLTYDPKNATATLMEPDSYDVHTVTIDTMARGIHVLTTGDNAGHAFSMSGMNYWKQFLLANRTNGIDGDYDSDIADNVLQAGLFGEVVYG